MITLHLIRHNGSSAVCMLSLQGPVPRVGELIHVPQEHRADLEEHEVAIVVAVSYRIAAGRLEAVVDAVASHDTPQDRQDTLRQCGWLDADLG